MRWFLSLFRRKPRPSVENDNGYFEHELTPAELWAIHHRPIWD